MSCARNYLTRSAIFTISYFKNPSTSDQTVGPPSLHPRLNEPQRSCGAQAAEQINRATRGRLRHNNARPDLSQTNIRFRNASAVIAIGGTPDGPRGAIDFPRYPGVFPIDGCGGSGINFNGISITN